MADQTPQAVGPEFEPFYEALRATPIGVVLADFDGRLLFTNQAIWSMLGFSEEEMRGKSWMELSPPEDAGQEQTLLGQLRVGSTYHYHSDKRCLRRDGSLFLGHWSVWRLDGSASPVLLAMITDQGQTDLVRRETEEHFRYLADTVPVMIWTSGVDGGSSYNNKRWMEFTGQSREQTLGKGWADAIHPEDRQRAVETNKRAFDRREPYQREYRLRRHDGEYRWVLGSGVPRFNPDGSFAGYIGSVIDVTELKHASEARQRSEERFRMAAQAGRMFAYEWDAATDVIVRSEGVAQVLGADEGVHTTGQQILTMVPPEDRERLIAAVAQLSPAEPYLRISYRMVRSDGTVIWVERNSRAHFDEQGKMLRLVGMVMDITQRKLAEEALKGMTRKLIEAQEQERSRIARELHDDINQRLALLSVEIQQVREVSPITYGELRSRMDELGKRTSEISAVVQSLSHELHSSRLEYLGLVSAMKGFCKEFGDKHKVEIDFSNEGIPSGIPPEISLCLFRIMQEGLQNALKHSGVKFFEVKLHGSPAEIRLTVRDSGVGYEPELAKDTPGLGLVSMRERVRLAKGTISVTSKPQSGTEINARVPLEAGAQREQGKLAGGLKESDLAF